MAATADSHPNSHQNVKGPLLSSQLFMQLPNHFNSPASADMDAQGNIYFSSPNFHNNLLAQSGKPAEWPAIGKITPDNALSTWYTFSVNDAPKITQQVAPMGIAWGPDGNLYVADMQMWFEGGVGQSRILRINVEDGKAVDVDVVVKGLMFPNALVWRGNTLFVTDTVLATQAKEYTVSGLYAFDLNELTATQPVTVSRYRHGQPRDPHLFERFVTDGTLSFGANGLTIDDRGNLYTGIMEDGTVHKTVLSHDNHNLGTTVFAQGMTATDGMKWDKATNAIYITDLFENAVYRIDMHGHLTLLARNGDTDGRNGELDAPSEVIIRGNEIIVMNFDAVFRDVMMTNTKTSTPFTLSVITLPADQTSLSRPESNPKAKP
ncbi:hypothetical protein ABT58_06020 [Photobacterium aphoticum]|uniref:SMP-30/Gluconolactonase/LRE-like region domain-containing protein n=1 Tax=Photobacterium aphoticum TaxID=754436 RepID=A0A0J1JJH4_9GAMM|nr:hypothetical protein ABT58_06020 [Photobacterium aphoticum]